MLSIIRRRVLFLADNGGKGFIVNSRFLNRPGNPEEKYFFSIVLARIFFAAIFGMIGCVFTTAILIFIFSRINGLIFSNHFLRLLPVAAFVGLFIGGVLTIIIEVLTSYFWNLRRSEMVRARTKKAETSQVKSL